MHSFMINAVLCALCVLCGAQGNRNAKTGAEKPSSWFLRGPARIGGNYSQRSQLDASPSRPQVIRAGGCDIDNLIVVRLGDASFVPLDGDSAYPVYWDKYTETGSLLATYPVQFTGDGDLPACTLGKGFGDWLYDADGLPSTSTDASLAAFPCLNTDANSDVSLLVDKLIVSLDDTGTVSYSAPLVYTFVDTFANAGVRQVATVDGTSFYMAGEASNDWGFRYVSPADLAEGTSDFLCGENQGEAGFYDSRGVFIYDGQLYGTSSNLDPGWGGVFTIGSGMPTSETGIFSTLLPGFDGSLLGTWQVLFESPSALWITTTDGADALGSIMGFVLDAGSWTANVTVPLDVNYPVYSIAGRTEYNALTDWEDHYVIFTTSEATLYRYDTVTQVVGVVTSTTGLQYTYFRGVVLPPCSTASPTPSSSVTGTPSSSATGTPSGSTTGTPSNSGTRSASPSRSASASGSASSSMSSGASHSPSASITGTPSPSSSGTPSGSQSSSPSHTGTASPSQSRTSSGSVTGTPSESSSPSTSATPSSTNNPSPSSTPSPSHTATPSPSHTGTPSPSHTGTPSSSGTSTRRPTPTPTHTAVPKDDCTAIGAPLVCYGDAIAAGRGLLGLPYTLTSEAPMQCGECWYGGSRLRVDDFILTFELEVQGSHCGGGGGGYGEPDAGMAVVFYDRLLYGESPPTPGKGGSSGCCSPFGRKRGEWELRVFATADGLSLRPTYGLSSGTFINSSKLPLESGSGFDAIQQALGKHEAGSNDSQPSGQCAVFRITLRYSARTQELYVRWSEFECRTRGVVRCEQQRFSTTIVSDCGCGGSGSHHLSGGGSDASTPAAGGGISFDTPSFAALSRRLQQPSPQDGEGGSVKRVAEQFSNSSAPDTAAAAPRSGSEPGRGGVCDRGCLAGFGLRGWTEEHHYARQRVTDLSFSMGGRD